MLDTTNAASLRTAQFLLDLPAAFDLSAGHSVTGNQLAKQIRADLAAAVRAGLLPKGIKIAVRQNAGRYWSARCGSLTVSISTWTGAVYNDAYIEQFLDGDKVYMPAGKRYAPAFAAALDLIEKVANRHNYSNSRIEEDYFDVGYYLSVNGGAAERDAFAGLRAEADLVVAFRAAEAA